MNDRLMDAFDDCLIALEQGRSLEDCLQKYPDLAGELRPRLKAALLAQNFVETLHPGPGLQAASRDKFLALAAELKAQQPLNGGIAPNGNHNHRTAVIQPVKPRPTLTGLINWLLHPLANQAVRMVVILLVIVLTGAGAMNASAQSVPGNPLYGLKRVIEDTRLALAPNSASRVQLQTEFSERRIQELHQVTGGGEQVSVEFGGVLTILTAHQWRIAETTIIIPAGIQIDGVPADGLYVWVKGTTQADRSVIAVQATVEGLLVQGSVKEIGSGVWQIEDWKIYTSDDTQISGSPRVGDRVEVNVWILPDGSWLAEQIRRISRPAGGTDDGSNHSTGDDNRASGEPLSTSASEDHQPAKTPPPVLQFTSTPSSSDGPGPNPTPTPPDGGNLKTAEPSKTPSPTRTPQPTRIPEPTRTVQATQPSNSGGPTPVPTSSQPQEVRRQGVLQSINGSTWVVDGQAFQADSSTAIEGSPRVGDQIEIRALTQPDGSLLATRIRKR